MMLAFQVLAHVLRLQWRIRQLRPTIVHTNSLKSAVYGGFSARIAGVPAVSHLRDRLAADYMPKRAIRSMRMVLRLVPAAVVANSEATLGTLGPMSQRRRSRCRVIYDPIPAAAGIIERETAHPFTVGMVGRISRWKGQHIFIEAFSRAFPSGSARAVIVGSPMFGESDYLAELEDQVARLRIGNRVQMTGFVDDVSYYMRQFDVLVHTSIIPEPFGMVVVEGMAAGLPVIASNAGGPAEVITPGVDGVLYRPGDVEALAAALKRLEESPAERLALGQAALSRAAEFRPQHIATLVEALYSDVAHGVL
jgi:glycosyltransferase involved in cell wall biosynthesis